MVNSTEFAKRLEKILDYYGISATAFSEVIEVNRSTISHLLSGRNKPSLEFIMKVIRHYPEVELYWLLNGKGTFPSESEKQMLPTHASASKKNTPVGTENLEPTAQNTKDTLKSDPKSKTNIERIVVFYKDGSFKSYEN